MAHIAASVRELHTSELKIFMLLRMLLDTVI